jgi:hypothetical protein
MTYETTDGYAVLETFTDEENRIVSEIINDEPSNMAMIAILLNLTNDIEEAFGFRITDDEQIELQMRFYRMMGERILRNRPH